MKGARAKKSMEDAVHALSTRVDRLAVTFDAKLSVLERLGEKVEVIVADEEVRAKNDEYLNQIRALEQQKVRLSEELRECNQRFREQAQTVCTQSAKISEQESELREWATKGSKSHTIGVDGEATLVKSIELLRDQFGAGFTFRHTAKENHSGDIIIEIGVKKKLPQGKHQFSILVDRKNYAESKVLSTHIEKGVSDALNRGTDAVVVVYNTIPDKKYPTGICEYENVATRFSSSVSFDPTFVKACTLDAFPMALSKLMFDFMPLKEDILDCVNTKESLKYAELAWLNLMDIVSPLLMAIDVKKISAAVTEAQASIVEMKRYLAVLPNKKGTELLQLLQKAFPEKLNGSKGGKVPQVCGKGIHLLDEADLSRKRMLLYEEGESSKAIKTEKGAAGVDDEDEGAEECTDESKEDGKEDGKEDVKEDDEDDAKRANDDRVRGIAPNAILVLWIRRVRAQRASERLFQA